MYGVHDVDPIAVDTARSFGIPRHARLYKITLPSALPYIMTGLRIASTVALILAFTGRALHGHARPRRDAQLRRGVRPDQPGVRARAGHGLPRGGDPLRDGRRRASRPALASLSADGSVREPAHLSGARDRGRDRRSDRDPRRLAAMDRARGRSEVPAPVDDPRPVPGAVALLRVRDARRPQPGAHPARLRHRGRRRRRARDPDRPLALGAPLGDASRRVLAGDAAAGADPDLDRPAPLDRQHAEGRRSSRSSASSRSC